MNSVSSWISKRSECRITSLMYPVMAKYVWTNYFNKLKWLTRHRKAMQRFKTWVSPSARCRTAWTSTTSRVTKSRSRPSWKKSQMLTTPGRMRLASSTTLWIQGRRRNRRQQTTIWMRACGIANLFTTHRWWTPKWTCKVLWTKIKGLRKESLNRARRSVVALSSDCKMAREILDMSLNWWSFNHYNLHKEHSFLI